MPSTPGQRAYARRYYAELKQDPVALAAYNEKQRKHKAEKVRRVKIKAGAERAYKVWHGEAYGLHRADGATRTLFLLIAEAILYPGEPV